ncbi:MAG: hypothetical protein Terrestrivirus4_58 [Terrestrivirus sp.]|uniref:Uncharacterized protein n=1 Tax=Terrestrivirus sp. TaxID=2487775 RepID=A0A3G4ZMD1_9VIRU|nr:MAG: hypothetical protein Terrestrivirus4_58 [Terrestrivirus sp.]
MSKPLFIGEDGTPFYWGSRPYDQNGQYIYNEDDENQKEIDKRHVAAVLNTNLTSTNTNTNSNSYQFPFESIVKRLFGSTTKK